MSISKLLFGEIALKKGLVTREQVEECLEIQEKLKEMGIEKSIGAIMYDKKCLNMVEVRQILREMQGEGDWNAIEGYEILEKLGKGGMGQVYRARHLKLDRDVAIKILSPDQTSNEEFLDRFKREAQAAARLGHENIVQAYDVGESYGYHYFVMEFVRGQPLKALIERHEKLPQGAAVEVARQMAAAMRHYDEHGMVHRDIKPANVLVDTEGVCKLCDMGLAKNVVDEETGQITQTGVIMGTPFYLSPEQARSEELDIRSDIYSLGVTLYHAVAGQVPFMGNSAATILYKHIFLDPPAPSTLAEDLSPEVERIITKMMEKAPDDRYESPDALLDDLADLDVGSDLSELIEKEAVPPTQEELRERKAQGLELDEDDRTLRIDEEDEDGSTAEAEEALAGKTLEIDEEEGDEDEEVPDAPEESEPVPTEGKTEVIDGDGDPDFDAAAREIAGMDGGETMQVESDDGVEVRADEEAPSPALGSEDVPVEDDRTMTVAQAEGAAPLDADGLDDDRTMRVAELERSGDDDEDWRSIVVAGDGEGTSKGQAAVKTKKAPETAKVPGTARETGPDFTPEEVARMERGDVAPRRSRLILGGVALVSGVVAGILSFVLWGQATAVPEQDGWDPSDPVAPALALAGPSDVEPVLQEARELADEGRFGAAAAVLSEGLEDARPAGARELVETRREVLDRARRAVGEARDRLEEVEAALDEDPTDELREERAALVDRLRAMEMDRLYRSVRRDLREEADPPALR